MMNSATRRTRFRVSVACGIALLFSSVSAARADLLVLAANPTVWLFDDHTGTLMNRFEGIGGIGGPETLEGISIGPDGNVYVTGNTLGWGDVYRFTRNGQFIGRFATDLPGGGRMTHLVLPGNLTFGPDGNCYVLGGSSLPGAVDDRILRYNLDGTFMGYFVTNVNARDLNFGRDGQLYVADANRGIVRYDGKTGAYMDTFVPIGAVGLPDVEHFIFGPDGNLYICTWSSNAVARYDGNSGQFTDYFVTPGSGGLDRPRALAFGLDGDLYVISYSYNSWGLGAIIRYDGRTGAFLNVMANYASLSQSQKFALINVHGLLFLPPLPQLQINPAGDAVEISWPSSSSARNWTLSKQRSLEATNQWTVVTNTPVLVGTNYVVTDQRDGIAAFYRLEQR